MNKKLSLSLAVLILSTVMAFGQKIRFEKNINYKASSLHQALNASRDSLILKSIGDRIQRVDIFSDDYTKQVKVDDYHTKIDLSRLPLGTYVVQAKIDKKWIVMSLEKYENMQLAEANPHAGKKKVNQVSTLQKSKIKQGTPKYCWVVEESLSGMGSYKSMKLEYTSEVAKLISKNKLELKSDTGRANKLIVYAIYDKSKFMTMQMRNPNYYKSVEESSYFDTNPYYISETAKHSKPMPETEVL